MVNITNTKTEYTYYIIEGLRRYFKEENKKYEGWKSCTEHVGDKYNINELLATGECWQTTGKKGTLDKSKAIDIILDLKRKILNGESDIVLTYRSCPSDREPYFEHIDYRIVEIKESYEANIL